MKLRRLKLLVTGLFLGVSLIIIAMPVTTMADFKSAACSGLSQLNSQQGCSTNANQPIANFVSAIVNILSIVVGLAAVVMVIVSGFKYVTSGGDSNRVASAKSTLVYALVGLVIVGAAQFLVHFVFTAVKP
ncbi:MAG TPA: pilin [Candidatus Dormibacteraeota bacterium]|nr:pilin [Candidatus Dormibacteraeota bacterium]